MENANSTTKIAKNPICGMPVDPQKAAATIEYEGHSYYFCSKGCATKFQQNPAKYLATSSSATSAPLTEIATTAHSCCSHAPATTPQKSQTPAPKKSAEGVRYTCPMHPQIVQIGPG